ncbi:alpha/beta fold hydrolase [uncultured Tateyamaria sp.]|uniref:alpha/beta fold hydrolase n=1 Tax=uncultured Tateyamaria sp. TaxID=455651 RepID=UPI00260B2758|nr:alpha/beta hydrolase [uncultured Tateyamaria sp.]
MTQTQHTVRHHGAEPAKVVVLHGGPGGAGEVEAFAHKLGHRGHAVLEPFQTQHSVGAQIEELREQITHHSTPPITLIGWSWGAWLGCLFAASHPNLVRKLVLVGSGPFEARHTEAIKATKAARLTDAQRAELATLNLGSGDPTRTARFIALNDVADTFERDTSPLPDVQFDADIHRSVWPEANAMRTSGALLDTLATIRCPVIALHGDHDPRPADGVRLPLQAALPSATFTLLEKCGHKPWQEVHAQDQFYQLIEAALD